jgi:type IV pilus assembly protein PilQ
MLRATLDKKNGKVLSMPKITTLNGNKAHLRVKTTRYHPITQFNPQGMPATDFRAIDDGITIDLTPYVTRHGDVNLEIKPSIKNALSVGDGARPADVMDRSISTNVRLMDGETLILGGLIDNQENKERRFIPILGSIPLLGYLFSWKSKSVNTKELVIFVTPRILPPEGSQVDLEEELEGLDSRGGWVKDKYFSRPKEAAPEDSTGLKENVGNAPTSGKKK